MGKLYTPTPISNIYSSVNTINQNWDDIADALDLTLARDGSTPNQMEASIDMNSNDIINAGAIYMDQLFVDGARIPSLQEIGETYADMLVALAAGEAAQLAAEQAQAGAETAETNAVAAQSAAETAQTAAELAETNAEASETAAALSETNAAASESAASTSASNAATSEANASGSASSAASSASAAEIDANEALNQRNSAETARDVSEDYAVESSNWATTPEDTPVPEGTGTEYSAFHWARKAQAAAGGSKRVGEVFALLIDQPGVTAPDNSGDEKYVVLSAGETGAGGYNEGLLSGETVSGIAPLVQAFAVVDVGPMTGFGLRLINTEERYIRGSDDATNSVLQDQMQRITGTLGDSVQHQTTTSQIEGTVSGAFSYEPRGSGNSAGSNASGDYSFDSADSPDARTSTSTQGETRPKSYLVRYYMRIQ